MEPPMPGRRTQQQARKGTQAAAISKRTGQRGRRAIQGTMQGDARSPIEELTDRDVIAFMSNKHIDPDLAIEIFILAPVAPPTTSADRGRTRRPGT